MGPKTKKEVLEEGLLPIEGQEAIIIIIIMAVGGAQADIVPLPMDMMFIPLPLEMRLPLHRLPWALQLVSNSNIHLASSMDVAKAVCATLVQEASGVPMLGTDLAVVMLQYIT